MSRKLYQITKNKLPISTSRENYDADYEASRIQTFISKFKDKEKEN